MKDEIREEFADVDTDDIKAEFEGELDFVVEDLEESFKAIKSGRASNDIFDELDVHVYGDTCRFGDLCQTIVRGEQLLTVKLFDPNIKDEILSALSQCDFDIEVFMQG